MDIEIEGNNWHDYVFCFDRHPDVIHADGDDWRVCVVVDISDSDKDGEDLFLELSDPDVIGHLDPMVSWELLEREDFDHAEPVYDWLVAEGLA